MAQGDLEIVNQGLAHLGESPLVSPTFADDALAGDLARLWYTDLRDAVLSEIKWNFAMRRVVLAVSGVPVSWGGGGAFPLPPDCIRVTEMQYEEQYDWGVEAHGASDAPHLFTQLGGPINIRYIKKVTDPSMFSPLFRQALAARIAMDFSQPLGKASTLTEQIAKLYNYKLQIARQVDSQEQTPEQIRATEWIDARGRSGTRIALTDSEPY